MMGSKRLFFYLFLNFIKIAAIYSIDCPDFTDVKRDSLKKVLSDATQILNFTKYDTNDMNFYVMSPRSYPNFENPQGESIDWSTLDCEGKPVLFNCHGYRETGLQVWAIDLVRTYVLQEGGCAVASDYRGASQNLNYLTVVSNTGNIAEAMASYIADNICQGTRNCTKELQLHGHSWGSHTCGIAGYLLGQSGLKPARMIASDAAGPYFNLLDENDSEKHMSKESANFVLNIRTSNIYGSSLDSWAHQTQIVGDCGSNQEQCSGISRLRFLQRLFCDHNSSIFMVKSTMEKNFPEIKLQKCSDCRSIIPSTNECSDEWENLGWRSEEKPGTFIIRKLPVCLNVTIDSELNS
ncbi:phospholipase A1-like [Ctenocephalides felis]|uniref:phospholipase A1-like n=1 Tax=Ctenocephalides felis TaxID=7515 RepID=UPI000E6E49A6|nr:phospholipase A1-like [Ctenocephalides felis]XP_026463455.1 phospholipase A1-like [Ctenocephalides felis]